MNLDEKKEIVKALHEKFSKSEIVILTDYKGLDVVTINDLRRKLRAEEVEYRVVKNSLLARASEGTGVTAMRDHFKGPSAVALSYKDPVAPAKVLTEFSEAHESLNIRVAVLGNKLLDPDGVKALSSLPSYEALVAQLLSVMNGVPRSFVTALSDIPRRLVNVLNALKEQKEAA